MSNSNAAPDWRQIFASIHLTLTPLEADAVQAAYENLTQTDASQHGVTGGARVQTNGGALSNGLGFKVPGSPTSAGMIARAY